MKIGRLLFQLLFVAIACGSSCQSQARPGFDARRLLTGTFHYRDYTRESPDGQSVIKVEKVPGGTSYVFSNVANGSSSQHWRALISPDFTPLSADLTFGSGAAARKVFSLSYQSAHVSGFFVPEPRVSGSAARPVNESVAPDTVDQRVDWAAVMSLKKYIPSQRILFHVYDPKAGNSTVVATVISHETIHVDAGTFQVARIVYQIAKSTGSEIFEVFVNSAAPRFLVKEVFPNGLISELVSKEP
ncbi:MAG TPA: hypothetical protein VHW70_00545 [Edaphobacter sp.]|jgi:hypothetical protein|nr:hypothetical protein [Edaphobacter sp.]